MQMAQPASRRGSSWRSNGAVLTAIGGSSGRITRCQTGASCALQSMKSVFIRFRKPRIPVLSGRFARLHPVADVACMDSEVGVDLLHLDRQHEWAGGKQAFEVLLRIGEHRLGDQPA